jgi:putative two-component system response regulator
MSAPRLVFGRRSGEVAASVLIMADSDENLSILGALLRSHYRVSVTTLAVGDWRQASLQPRPDLILLDVMLPGQDACAALAGLRENPDTADIPVLVLAAPAAAADEARARALGVADYIVKPVMFLLLLEKVRAHLEARFAHYRTNWPSIPNGMPRAAAPPPTNGSGRETPRRRSHERV